MQEGAGTRATLEYSILYGLTGTITLKFRYRYVSHSVFGNIIPCMSRLDTYLQARCLHQTLSQVWRYLCGLAPSLITVSSIDFACTMLFPAGAKFKVQAQVRQNLHQLRMCTTFPAGAKLKSAPISIMSHSIWARFTQFVKQRPLSVCSSAAKASSSSYSSPTCCVTAKP